MDEALVQGLIRVGEEFYRRGWMLATGGNLSARAGDRGVMTASGGHKGRLTDASFLEWSLGSPFPTTPRPSAEAAVHAAVYRALPDVGAILHVHSPYATVVSRSRERDGRVDVSGYEFVKALGFWDEGAEVALPIVPNHAAIPELAAAIEAAIGAAPVVLVSGHGLYAWGESIDAAQRHVEAAEFLCRMAWESDRT